jgi:tight adherence protein B
MASELAWVLAAAGACVGLASVALLHLVRRGGAQWREWFRADLGAGLRQSFVYLDVGRLFRLNVAAVCGLGLFAFVLTGEPLVALAVAGGAGALPGVGLAWMRARRLARLRAQLPDAVMLVAGALRAGSSLPQSIAQAARELPSPAGREFDLVVREQRLGVGLDASMSGLERRAPLEEVTLFAAAVRIAQESGGNLAETLERLAETLRRKAAVEGKIDALTAQGRLQGWVMTALPVIVGAVLVVIEPQAMRPLWVTWQGWVVCAGIVALLALGLHVIRRIVDIDV